MNFPTPHADPEARKQRLLREALANAGNHLPSTESIGQIFVAAGLIVMTAAAISGVLPVRDERVVTLATEPNAASARPAPPTAFAAVESSQPESGGNVQDMTY